MRNALCRALWARAADPDLVFLTGDLGYDALEPLRAKLGERFINAGVAEQNMVCVAAGLAAMGWRPWAYSIAPFICGRPFEQVRNDVCLHDLPVALVGNGGGYAYGVMGPTHHALEDYGTLLCLPNLRAFIPAFGGDVEGAVAKIAKLRHPAYLRLGRAEEPAGFGHAPFAPWRRIVDGAGPTLVVVGPLAGTFIEPLAALARARRPALWVLAELPLRADRLPARFLDDLRRSRHLVVVEEHVAHGGVGQALASALLSLGRAPARFAHRHARGYVSGTYGSQTFHRAESGLAAAAVLAGLGG